MKHQSFYITFIAHLVSTILLLGACSNHPDTSDISSRLAKAEAIFLAKEADEALAILLELENNLDKSVPDTLKYKVLSRIGGIYYADFKKDKADLYFKRAMMIARKCENEYLSGALWNRCLTLSNNDSILILLKECMDVSRQCNLRYTEVMAGVNLANAYAQLGNRNKALELLDTMREVIGDDRMLKYEYSFALQNILIADKQFDKAIELLDNQKVEDLNLFGKLSRFQNYFTIEMERKQFFKAVSYRDSIDKIKNEIDSIEYDKKLLKIESDFLSRLDKERAYRKNTALIALCVIILLVYSLFWRIKRAHMMKRQLELNEQISRLNLRIVQLTETHDEMSPSSMGEGNVNVEIIQKLRLNRELFMSSPIYGQLQQLNLRRDADSIDKALAKEVLDAVIGQFADVCSNLRQLYTELTYDDALYCSAIYVGFTKELASVAIGSSEDALRRRKSRIKQKLPTAVFEALFGTKL